MKAAGIVLVGAALIVVAILAFAPATLIDRELASASAGKLRIAEARGSVWSGHGVLATSDGIWRVPLAWKLHPLAAARGVAELTLLPASSTASLPRGRLEFARDRLEGDRVALALPMDATIGVDAHRIAGELALVADAITLAPTGNVGSATLEWRNARWKTRGHPLLDFGTVTARLAVRGNEWAGPVVNQGGDVLLRGDVVFGHERMHLNLELAPVASADPDVRAALAALGPADASGAVRLRVDHRLR